MVFTNLPPHEKTAFFSLLDEYFSSRPDVLGGGGGSGSAEGAAYASAAAPTPGSIAARAMLANPEATAKVASAGLRHFANTRTTPPTTTTGAEAEEEPVQRSVAGRIAAFSAQRNSVSGPPPIADKPSSVSSLTSSKKIGNFDTSSKMGFMGSMIGGKKDAKPPPSAPIPSAFAPRSNSSSFAPPPVRRAPSSASSVVRQPTPEPTPPPPPPPPAPPIRRQEEPQGEWVEALYEYNSGEVGDLVIEEGQRVLLLERTSDDWWTGEVNGKKGLFPASYVKAL